MENRLFALVGIIIGLEIIILTLLVRLVIQGA